jgi:hypothetical protein
LDRRSTGQHASQSDKRAARTRSRIQVPECGHALDMGLVAFGMSSVNRFCDCCRAARSSPQVLRCGPPGHALIDQREVDVRASTNRSRVGVLGV